MGYAGGGQGANAPPGVTRRVLDAAPGTLELWCNRKDFNEEAPHLETEIVDPDGLYLDARLSCDEVSTQISDYAQPPEGEEDPKEVARDQLDFGMQEGDELRGAGYPEERNPTYVVVRDGRVLASTELRRGAKGWYTDGYDACSNFDS